MRSVKPLPEFTAWLDGLKDRVTRLRLVRRLDKAQRGNLGDVNLSAMVFLKCVSILGLAGACIIFSAMRL